MALPRMRTIKEVIEELKQADPNTAIREYYVRDLVTNNKIPHIRAGRKILINFDVFLEYLQDPGKFEPAELPHHLGGIRKISDVMSGR